MLILFKPYQLFCIIKYYYLKKKDVCKYFTLFFLFYFFLLVAKRHVLSEKLTENE